MTAIKTIIKAAFLGAFLLGFAGMVIGGIAALFIWPSSNLGPPVGAVYGFIIGVFAGFALGLAFGVVRALKSRPAHENHGNDAGTR